MTLSATLAPATSDVTRTYEWAQADVHWWGQADTRTYEWAQADVHWWGQSRPPQVASLN